MIGLDDDLLDGAYRRMAELAAESVHMLAGVDSTHFRPVMASIHGFLSYKTDMAH